MEMTEEEFELLDHLYFLISFDELMEASGQAETELVTLLKQIHQKGWLKVVQTDGEEPVEDFGEADEKHQKYSYIASKAGLMAHNSK